MTTLTTLRDRLLSWWPTSSRTTTTPAASAPATAPATNPGVGGAPSSFEAAKKPSGPVLSPRELSEADVKKIAERVGNMVLTAEQAKGAAAWPAGAPPEVTKLTRSEQQQVLDFANRRSAMLADWAKTSPLSRGTGVKSRDEIEQHFDEQVFKPAFAEFTQSLVSDAVRRFDAVAELATEMKAGANWAPGTPASVKALDTEELKLVGMLANGLYERLLKSEQGRNHGPRPMTREEGERRFMDNVFLPECRTRLSEYFMERLG